MVAVQVIQQYSGVNAVWMPDVVGRAYGNRGNARSRQVGGWIEAGIAAVTQHACRLDHSM